MSWWFCMQLEIIPLPIPHKRSSSAGCRKPGADPRKPRSPKREALIPSWDSAMKLQLQRQSQAPVDAFWEMWVAKLNNEERYSIISINCNCNIQRCGFESHDLDLSQTPVTNFMTWDLNRQNRKDLRLDFDFDIDELYLGVNLDIVIHGDLGCFV